MPCRPVSPTRCCRRTDMASGKCSTSASPRKILRVATDDLGRHLALKPPVRGGHFEASMQRPGRANLAPHRAPGVGGELPAPGDDHDRRRRDEQDPGTDEPAKIAQRKEKRA